MQNSEIINCYARAISPNLLDSINTIRLVTTSGIAGKNTINSNRTITDAKTFYTMIKENNQANIKLDLRKDVF